MIHLTQQARTKIKIVFCSFLCLVLIIQSPSLYHYFHRKKQPVSLNTYRVSFHVASEVPAIQDLIAAAINFCATQGITLETKKFYHHQDMPLLKAQIEESIAWESKAIVSIGNISAQNIHNILTKRNSKVPHIFTCVCDPIKLGISESKHITGTQSTGIAEDSSGAQEACIESLLHVRPDAKKVLIFYNAAYQAFKEVIDIFTAALAEKNIETKAIAVNNLDDINRFSQAYINRDIDVVMIPRDALVVTGLQQILKMCRIHGVTCFASDSRSVRNGAVAGSCIEESDIGLLVAELIIKIVDQGIAPETIPIMYFNTALLCHTYINPYEMKTQGLHNRSIYELMKSEMKLEILQK